MKERQLLSNESFSQYKDAVTSQHDILSWKSGERHDFTVLVGNLSHKIPVFLSLLIQDKTHITCISAHNIILVQIQEKCTNSSVAIHTLWREAQTDDTADGFLEWYLQ